MNNNEPTPGKKFIIVDGNGLAYRAFYALPPLKTSQGEPVNAVYGFTNMLFKIIEREKPDFIAVAFDKSKPTLRTDMFEEYKAHRIKMPEDLQSQFPMIEQVVRVLKIPVFHLEGYEADDCIATLVHRAEEKDLMTRIYSGDLDMLQLVSPRTQVVTTRRGITDLVIYDEEMVRKRYGIDPPQLVDYKALAGDSSDHIPGIPGIGEASASKLLNQFRNVETMYEESERIPSRWKRQILENREQAFLSRDLALLRTELPLNIDWDDMSLKEPDRQEMKKLFIRLEFKTMLRELGFSEDELNDIQEISVQIVGKDEDLDAMLQRLKTAGHFSLVWVYDEEGHLMGLALGEGKNKGYYFPFILPEQLNISSTFGISTFSRERILHELRPLFDSENITKYVFNLKDGICFLKRGEYFQGANFVDIAQAVFLLDPETPPRTLEGVLSKYSNFVPKSLEEILSTKKTKKKLKIIEVPLQDLTLFMAGRAVRLNKTAPRIMSEIKEKEGDKLFFEVDMPIISLLYSMERRGISVSEPALMEESDKMTKTIEEISRQIFHLAGEEFNLQSPKQLGTILFEKLGLDPGGKKGEFKTGSEVLEKMTSRHAIIPLILEYKELYRQKSAYIDGLLNQSRANLGKVHPIYSQTVSPLGKVTSSSPNLNNIPSFLKRVFTSSPERVFVSFEYPDMDMRILAHLSQDENLLKLFREDQNPDVYLACGIFNLPEEELTPSMTEIAREISQGIMGGLSPHQISQKTGVSRNNVKDYINTFYRLFPSVEKFMEHCLESARETQYVENIMGRRMFLPNITSQNKVIRQIPERNVITMKVMGSCTDLMKKVMVDIYNKVLKNHRDIHMVIYAGYEMVFDMKDKRMEKYSNQIRECMATDLPLKIVSRHGNDWASLKEDHRQEQQEYSSSK